MNPSKAVGCALLLSGVLVVGLGAPDATAFQRAKADLRGPNGITGTARLVEDANGNVLVTIHVTGHPAFLTPGRHGVHIHEVGACDSPGFTTAGGHFDPGPFGNGNTVTNHPFHSGDLENLVVNRDGVGRLIDVTTRVTLSPSDLTVFDDNGSAIIIHALEDQRSCQPDPASGLCTGVSGGARLACGVIHPEDD
jgi:Cu-Zn family superoxide dismutase